MYHGIRRTSDMNNYLVFILLNIVGFTASIDIYLKHEDGPIKLVPQSSDGVVISTEWILKSCRGCKIGVNCYFNTSSCYSALIFIDIGDYQLSICPEDQISIHEVSSGNKMTLRIIHSKLKKPVAFCKAKATRQYINLPESSKPIADYHGLLLAGYKKPTCHCGFAVKNPGRIVGGLQTSPNEFSFFVQLVEDGVNVCGGAIITNRHIITAAHCTYVVKGQLSIIVGMHDLSSDGDISSIVEIPVKEIINHPNYDNDNIVNDIAILLLTRRIQFNNFIGPICMPKFEENIVGKYITVMGYGRLQDEGDYSTINMKVQLKVIERDICSTVHNIGPDVEPSVLCTFNKEKDTCEGDSGGPLVIVNPNTNMYQLVGVVSYGELVLPIILELIPMYAIIWIGSMK